MCYNGFIRKHTKLNRGDDLSIKKMLFQRYILYPIIIGFVTYHVLGFVAVTPLKEAINQFGLYGMIDQTFGIELSYEEGKLIYSYVVGFAYGTVSQFIKIHKMKAGLFTIILALLKYYMCFYAFGTIAFFWIPIEVVLIVFISIIMKLLKKTKKVILINEGV